LYTHRITALLYASSVYEEGLLPEFNNCPERKEAEEPSPCFQQVDGAVQLFPGLSCSIIQAKEDI